MSPAFINTNDHAIRVDDGASGGKNRLRRIRAGAVVEADGAFADNLSATAGVSSASSEQRRTFEDAEERRAAHDKGTGPAVRLDAKLALGPARVALRHQTTAAPLQRMVGDDQAPFGPPTGTITTKLDHLDGADPKGNEVRALAPGEAGPLGPIDAEDEVAPGLPGASSPSSAAVHNAQVANDEAANEAAQAVIAGEMAPHSSGVTQGSRQPPSTDDGELRGQALEDALEQRGLAKSGSADEKRARVAEHDKANA